MRLEGRKPAVVKTVNEDCFFSVVEATLFDGARLFSYFNRRVRPPGGLSPLCSPGKEVVRLAYHALITLFTICDLPPLFHLNSTLEHYKIPNGRCSCRPANAGRLGVRDLRLYAIVHS